MNPRRSACQSGPPPRPTQSQVNAWSGTCYLTPLLGAWVADTFLGRFWAIFSGSIIYMLVRLMVLQACTWRPDLPLLDVQGKWAGAWCGGQGKKQASALFPLIFLQSTWMEFQYCLATTPPQGLTGVTISAGLPSLRPAPGEQPTAHQLSFFWGFMVSCKAWPEGFCGLQAPGLCCCAPMQPNLEQA